VASAPLSPTRTAGSTVANSTPTNHEHTSYSHSYSYSHSHS
jgi:hypothetical protein